MEKPSLFLLYQVGTSVESDTGFLPILCDQARVDPDDPQALVMDLRRNDPTVKQFVQDLALASDGQGRVQVPFTTTSGGHRNVQLNQGTAQNYRPGSSIEPILPASSKVDWIEVVSAGERPSIRIRAHSTQWAKRVRDGLQRSATAT